MEDIVPRHELHRSRRRIKVRNPIWASTRDSGSVMSRSQERFSEKLKEAEADTTSRTPKNLERDKVTQERKPFRQVILL